MIKYQRITLLEQEEISRHLASGYSLRAIATNLRRATSSISREIRQSGVVELKYYRAIYVHQHSNKTRHKWRKNRKLNNNIPLRKVNPVRDTVTLHYLPIVSNGINRSARRKTSVLENKPLNYCVYIFRVDFATRVWNPGLQYYFTRETFLKVRPYFFDVSSASR